jgi:transposase
MGKTSRKPCAGCESLQTQVDALQTRVDALLATVSQQGEQLAAARKTSSTSSKPPSSDIVKPRPPTDESTGKRSIGGQIGHPKHERVPFPPEQITRFAEHPLQACPCCTGELKRTEPLDRIIQQVDIDTPALTIEQHTRLAYWCANCQRSYFAPLPLHIDKGGLVGPRLTGLIAYMKGPCHASYSTVRTFLRDVARVAISRSEVCNIIKKVTEALAVPYSELLKMLPNEAFVNVDETGHPCNGDNWWTWCFRAELYTLYHIDAYRNAEVMMDTLGVEFAGVLGCDYFSAYRRYMRECSVRVQFCLAHLIRDVKFLATLPDARDRQYGERLRTTLKELFEVFHQREQLGETERQARLSIARVRVLQAGKDAPGTQHGRNMAKRFEKHGESYFTFITTPGVGPTNNLAEQAIRFVVIDRHITQGTRSESGQRWNERIWTVIATCVQQEKSVHDYLQEAVDAWFCNGPAPSLLPKGLKE